MGTQSGSALKYLVSASDTTRSFVVTREKNSAITWTFLRAQIDGSGLSGYP